MQKSTKSVVCVTGATGFIGSHLVRELLSADINVHALVRHPENPEKTIHLKNIAKDLGACELLNLHAVALEQPTTYEHLIQQADYIFHLGSPVAGSGIVADALYGTKQLLTSIVQSPNLKGIAFASSIAAIVSQRRTPNHIYTESDWFDAPFRDNYATSKTLAEKLVWNFAVQSGSHLKVLVINPTLVVGPALANSHFNSSLKLLMDLIQGRHWGPPPCAAGIVHVKDVARFLRLGMQSELTGRYILNAGNLWFDEIIALMQQEFPFPMRYHNRMLGALRFVMASIKRHGISGIFDQWQRNDQICSEKSRRSTTMEWSSPADAIRDFCRALR